MHRSRRSSSDGGPATRQSTESESALVDVQPESAAVESVASPSSPNLDGGGGTRQSTESKALIAVSTALVDVQPERIAVGNEAIPSSPNLDGGGTTRQSTKSESPAVNTALVDLQPESAAVESVALPSSLNLDGGRAIRQSIESEPTSVNTALVDLQPESAAVESVALPSSSNLDGGRATGQSTESGASFSTVVSTSQGVATYTSADRLSELPNELIFLILSRLETKYVFRACAVSRRLMRLCGYVPTIRLDDGHNEDDAYPRGGTHGWGFVEFGLRRLRLLNIDELEIFQLRSGMDLENNGLDGLVAIAAQQRVKIFDITGTGIFPVNVFTNPTVRVLKLASVGGGTGLYIPDPRVVNLPNLEVLCLSKVEPWKNVVIQLFRGCPCLQELNLHEVYFFEDLHVSIPTLKSFLFQSTHRNSLNMHFDTPKLEEFEYRVRNAGKLFWVKKPEVLHRARIRIKRVVNYENMCRFFSRMKGISYLQLSELSLQIAQDTPSIFEDVKSLSLRVHSLQTVMGVVQSTPKLEVLLIDKARDDNDEEKARDGNDEEEARDGNDEKEAPDGSDEEETPDDNDEEEIKKLLPSGCKVFFN